MDNKKNNRSARNKKIHDLHAKNYRVCDIAKKVGVPSSVVYYVLKDVLKKENHSLSERNQDIINMFSGGNTYAEIGEKHKISRERVRQVITSSGFDLDKGGAKLTRRLKRERAVVASELNRKQRAARDEKKSIEIYGAGSAEVSKVPEWFQRRYRQKRRNCIRDGIAFNISLTWMWAEMEKSGIKASAEAEIDFVRLHCNEGFTTENTRVTHCVDTGRMARAHDHERAEQKYGKKLIGLPEFARNLGVSQHILKRLEKLDSNFPERIKDWRVWYGEEEASAYGLTDWKLALGKQTRGRKPRM